MAVIKCVTLLVAAFLLLTSVSAIDYCVPSESCWPSAAEVASFKQIMSATQARVMSPDDADWVGKSLTFNQAEAETPGLIAFVGTVDHIREALKFAFKYNIRVSIVSSGHSFYGRCGAEGSLQISTHFMKGIDVDLSCSENKDGCITMQSGVQWGEAYREADKYNRIVMGGSNPTVSVTGWTLGGGHSPLTRKFGLGVHNVLEFHMVMADLSEVWARQDGTVIKKLDDTTVSTNDTSLFWALRGGGSAFGVLVDLKVKLHPGSKITQHICYYPAFTDGTPKTYEVMFKSMGDILLNAPNNFGGYILPSVDCDQTTKKCDSSSLMSVVHYGERENSEDDAWFRRLESLPHEWARQGLMGGGCGIYKYDSFYAYEMTIPNVTYVVQYLGGSLVQGKFLTDQLVETITEHLNKTYYSKTKLGITAIWVGGAVKDVPVGQVPVHPGWSDAVFSLSAGTNWDPQVTQDASKLKDTVRNFHKDLERFSDGKYYNEAEPDMTPTEWKRNFWDQSTYNRLMTIKANWDPKNKFTCKQCLGEDWDPETDGSFFG